MNPESTSSTSSFSEPPASTLASLLKELRQESTDLLRQEVELAKAELSEKASRLGGHATQIGIGGFVAYAGLIVLLFAIGDLVGSLLLNAGVDAAVAVWLGRLLVGLVVAIVGWAMLARAKNKMKSDDLVPEQTIQSLRENKQWMQRKLQPSHESI
jgi:hypothetical protein